MTGEPNLKSNELKDVHPDEYQFFSQYGVTSVLAAPFSKRLNQGYIAVDDPTQFRNDPTFLFIISYAIVLELNELKIPKRAEIATETNTRASDNLQDPHGRPHGDRARSSTPAILYGASCQAAIPGNR